MTYWILWQDDDNMSIQIPIPSSVSSRACDKKTDLSGKQAYNNNPCLLVFVAVLAILIVGCVVTIGILLNGSKTSEGEFFFVFVRFFVVVCF